MEMRRLYGISSAAGLTLALAAMAVQTSCFFVFDDNDCSQYLSPHCFDGGSSTDGGDSGPPPSCIPSASNPNVANMCGVFVSPTGSDANGKGTQAEPYQTITHALTKGSTIYACAGTVAYSEPVVVDKPVALFGALDCTSSTWAYDAANKTQLTAPSDAVPLTLSSAAGGTEVSDFSITAADATKDGHSSIGVIADGITASFARTDITAGNGAAGTNGTTPTASVGPSDPTDPMIAGKEGSNACMDPSQQFGGASVTNPMCNSIGGRGGIGAVSNGSNGDVSPATPQTALGGTGQPNTDPGNTWSCMPGSGLGGFGLTGAEGDAGAGAKLTDLGTLDATAGYTGVAGQPGCPMYGVNQAECCDGETAEAAPVRTSELAATPSRNVEVQPPPPLSPRRSRRK
jgi:hypothetical protein